MSSPSTIARVAGLSDVPEIINLVKASWARTYDPVIGEVERIQISGKKHVPDLFISEIENEDACGIVAVDQANTVIGYAGGQIRGARVFFVDHLHVDPEWYGKNVAVEIIRCLAETIHPIADCIELTVLNINARAVGFYMKVGFVESTGSNEDDGLAGVPSILMRLEI